LWILHYHIIEHLNNNFLYIRTNYGVLVQVMNNDEHFMHMALQLARKGMGYVSPNPQVGAVIVKDGRIIGAGYHKRYGDRHAEVNALRNAREDITGATLYVTLEPCCHEGKTPPCVDSIVRNKIARVVIGAVDPNPLVCSEGINYLRSRGLAVETGVLESQCRRMNETFFHYMETGRPFITIKYAQTLDGRIATLTGNSQWISSAKARKYTHQLRAWHDAVLVGAGTVIKDNPELTVRLVRGRNPLRIIVDANLRIPLEAKILQNVAQAKTIIATTKDKASALSKKIAKTGAEIMTVAADKNGNVDLAKLFKALALRGISSVLVEGGAQIITSVLKGNLADRLMMIIAPKIIGKGIEAIGDLQIRNMESAKILSIQKVKKIGPDILIDGRLT
jgi:diaminohydroxyphosphoribosylaminopyrimidine deaminase/5-amino-6-(5-phosphoribosylamino)uracil reductase